MPVLSIKESVKRKTMAKIRQHQDHLHLPDKFRAMILLSVLTLSASCNNEYFLIGDTILVLLQSFL